MIKNLIKVAERLDSLGLSADADKVDRLIRIIAKDGFRKEAGYSDLTFRISNEISEEEAKVKKAIPDIIRKHLNLLKDSFEAKFPRWKMQIDFTFTEPELYGAGKKISYDDGSVSMSVEINCEVTEDIYSTFFTDLEEMDKWLRSEAEISLDFGDYNDVWMMETSDLPIKGGGAFTL